MPPQDVTGTCQTCAAHPLIEQNVTSMRETFDRFVAQEGTEHARLRESLLRQAEQFHQQLLEVATLAAQTKGAISLPDTPHAHERAGEDGPHVHERHDSISSPRSALRPAVAINLTREDLMKILWWSAIGIGILVVLVIGFATVAGRDGYDIWNRAATKIIPGGAK